MKKQAIRLETIALYATNYSFVRYRQMVCSKQSYGLQHLKLSFTSSKAIVYVFCFTAFIPIICLLHSIFQENPNKILLEQFSTINPKIL